ncbi:hypothetical protein NIES4075_15100 [Tolypothrix sp. NIES-4075]|uniref:hypothetical protein n=1 Tax=Tolypothrix sp. NIES-4075 TaxID=2005459 RepID=UPI000B5CAC1F|nr:hypothetical protein [Tolypothrix sp. NIES-4075]GAX40544.1 hypothetical protein NIES4075_15100 [Tolypothrix sp. NIES-4075]
MWVFNLTLDSAIALSILNNFQLFITTDDVVVATASPLITTDDVVVNTASAFITTGYPSITTD